MMQPSDGSPPDSLSFAQNYAAMVAEEVNRLKDYRVAYPGDRALKGQEGMELRDRPQNYLG